MRYIGNNRIVSYAGRRSNGLFVLPASNTAWVNTTPHDVEVHVFGGTVTGIKRNGQDMTGMTSGSMILPPGDSVTLTYSVAPTMIFHVRP